MLLELYVVLFGIGMTWKYFQQYKSLPVMNCLNVQANKAPHSLPQKQTAGSAGFDICSVEPVKIPPHTRMLIRSGWAVQIPEGCVGDIRSRSSLACKGIDVLAGVIDSDYRGELKVLLQNSTAIPFEIDAGDRIAQLLVLPLWNGEIQEVDYMAMTSRGTGGFGSTGKGISASNVAAI